MSLAVSNIDHSAVTTLYDEKRRRREEEDYKDTLPN